MVVKEITDLRTDRQEFQQIQHKTVQILTLKRIYLIFLGILVPLMELRLHCMVGHYTHR